MRKDTNKSINKYWFQLTEFICILHLFDSNKYIYIFLCFSSYHNVHLFAGFIGVPNLQLKSLEKCSELLNEPITRYLSGA